MSEQGTAKWLNDTKGYGFICRQNGDNREHDSMRKGDIRQDRFLKISLCVPNCEMFGNINGRMTS